MIYTNKAGGYIALMTTVILGLVMLTLLVVASNLGFSSRFNILDSEMKEVSIQSARSCGEIVILRLKQNDMYEGGTKLSVGGNHCWVFPIEQLESVFRVQSVINNAYTNFEVSKDGATWTECAYFDTGGACILP